MAFLHANCQSKQLYVESCCLKLGEFQETGIELDKFELSVNYDFDLSDICNRLICLHKNGQIKHLNVHIDVHEVDGYDFFKELDEINFLFSLSIIGFNCVTPNLSLFVNLKKMCFDDHHIGLRELEPFAQTLINLEELYNCTYVTIRF